MTALRSWPGTAPEHSTLSRPAPLAAWYQQNRHHYGSTIRTPSYLEPETNRLASGGTTLTPEIIRRTDSKGHSIPGNATALYSSCDRMKYRNEPGNTVRCNLAAVRECYVRHCNPLSLCRFDLTKVGPGEQSSRNQNDRGD